MDALWENNRVTVSGWVREAPQYSHALYGEAFFTMQLTVPRLSGAEDILPVTFGERTAAVLPLVGEALCVTGQLRSYNRHETGKSRLVVTLFARRITPSPEDAAYENDVELTGYVCKPPIYRTTPFLREITDLLVAVNRSYHKSDYLPVIAWGRNARYAAGLTVGQRVAITGRVQSRVYQKVHENGETELRTVYEVSATTIAPAQADSAAKEAEPPTP